MAIFEENQRFGNGIANIGWQNNLGENLMQFGYISSYKDIADITLDHRGNCSLIDQDVFAVVFLYRQYIELLLKHIYFSQSPETDNQKSTFIRSHGHNLPDMWAKVQTLGLSEISNPACQAQMNYVLNQINQYDSHSFSFRYFYDTRMNPTLPAVLSVNLFELKECIDKIDTFLFGLYGV